MAVKKIIKFPEKILLNKTEPVKNIDDSLKAFIEDMFDTMYFNDGVGLSANQVGVPKRIAVMNPSGKKEDALVLINPDIIKKKGCSKAAEGCLSLPGISSDVKRSSQIEVKFMDLEGGAKHLKLEGLSARIVQHEVDHLNGFLFVDRINFLKRKLLLKKMKKAKRI